MHLENSLLELVKDLCLENKPVESEIRLFLVTFKFPLRMIYEDILTRIIEVLEDKFIILLQKIPEILPYDLSES